MNKSNKTEEILDLTCKETLAKVDKEIKDYQNEMLVEILTHKYPSLIVPKNIGKAC